MKTRIQKTDSELLQGDWTVTALEMDGEKTPEELFESAHIVLDGDRFQSLGMGATYEGKLVLNPNASPKTFDLKFTKGPEKGNTALGIYELDGDEWKICLTNRPGDRPKKFVTKPGMGHALEILKRGKPAKKATTSPKMFKVAAKPQKAAGSGPATELEGEWAMVSGSLNGKPLDAIAVQYGVRSLRGNLTTLKFGPELYIEATFALDPSKSPREIDYTHLKGMFAGKHQLGIYECDGKTLKLSASTPGTPRPKDFEPGPGRNVTTFKLAKK